MTDLNLKIASTIIKHANQLDTCCSVIKLTSCIKKSQEIWIKLNYSTNLTTNLVNRKTEKQRFKRQNQNNKSSNNNNCETLLTHSKNKRSKKTRS